MHAPGAILSLYAVETWLNDNSVLLQDISPSVVFLIDTSDLEKISSRSTPNQALAIVKKKPQNGTAPSGVFLMLDGIQDPGNFGTIVRTADWFGINTMLCSPECADLYNPKVVQSTMGSILRVDVVYTSLTDWCKANERSDIYAATLHGRSVYECTPVSSGGILIGNESKGIHPQLLSSCKAQITIPRTGYAESLNAAVATGIILSHLVKH